MNSQAPNQGESEASRPETPSPGFTSAAAPMQAMQSAISPPKAPAITQVCPAAMPRGLRVESTILIASGLA